MKKTVFIALYIGILLPSLVSAAEYDYFCGRPGTTWTPTLLKRHVLSLESGFEYKLQKTNSSSSSFLHILGNSTSLRISPTDRIEIAASFAYTNRRFNGFFINSIQPIGFTFKTRFYDGNDRGAPALALLADIRLSSYEYEIRKLHREDISPSLYLLASHAFGNWTLAYNLGAEWYYGNISGFYSIYGDYQLKNWTFFGEVYANHSPDDLKAYLNIGSCFMLPFDFNLDLSIGSCITQNSFQNLMLNVGFAWGIPLKAKGSKT